MEIYEEYITIKIKKSYLKKILILMLVILCTFGVSELYEDSKKRYSTPEVIVNKIMDLWEKGYYYKMYGILDITNIQNNVFLNKQDFIKSFRNNQLLSYSISKKTLNENKEICDFEVSLNINGKTKIETVSLKKQNDKWVVNPNIFIEEVKVECPKYMTLKINNKKIQFLGENQSNKVKVFLGSSLKVTYESSYIDSQDNVLVAGKSMNKITPSTMDVKLSSKSESNLKLFINEFVAFNNRFTINTEYKEMEKYIKEPSKASKYYREKLNPYVDSPLKIEDYTIEKIEFSNQKIFVYIKEEKTKDIITLGVETFDKENFKISSIYREHPWESKAS